VAGVCDAGAGVGRGRAHHRHQPQRRQGTTALTTTSLPSLPPSLPPSFTSFVLCLLGSFSLSRGCCFVLPSLPPSLPPFSLSKSWLCPPRVFLSPSLRQCAYNHAHLPPSLPPFQVVLRRPERGGMSSVGGGGGVQGEGGGMWRDGGAAIGRDDVVSQDMFDAGREGGGEGGREGGRAGGREGSRGSFYPSSSERLTQIVAQVFIHSLLKLTSLLSLPFPPSPPSRPPSSRRQQQRELFLPAACEPAPSPHFQQPLRRRLRQRRAQHWPGRRTYVLLFPSLAPSLPPSLLPFLSVTAQVFSLLIRLTLPSLPPSLFLPQPPGRCTRPTTSTSGASSPSNAS